MNGVVYMYGIEANDLPGKVTIRLAFLPGVTDPVRCETPIAYALFIVHALNACDGVSLILMHPSAITILMSPEGDEPGL